MVRVVLAVGLLVGSLAVRANVTTYDWTIDWSSGPDWSGTLVFDDRGDATARSYFWSPDIFPSPGVPGAPPGLQGLPPGFLAFGSLSFDGTFVSGWRGCNDAVQLCSVATAAGFVRADFTLSANGTAERAVYSFAGPGPSPCIPSSIVAGLPNECFTFDTGTTTFAVAATPATPVPEPGTLALLIAGLAGIGMFAQGRRR